MYVDTKWMADKFDYYNKLCFSGKCPPCEFKVNKSIRYWGLAHVRWVNDEYDYSVSNVGAHGTDFTITMSNSYDSPEEIKINTLVHEMIHIMDYKYNVGHFLSRDYRGRLKKRKYDAHGPIYFQPECDRLKQYGLKIYQCVQAEEEALSTLNEDIANREYLLMATHFDLRKTLNCPNEVFWLKTSENSLYSNILPIVFRIYGKPYDFLDNPSESKIKYIDIYKTHCINYQTYSTSRTYRGYYVNEKEWDKVLDKLGNDKEEYKIIEYVPGSYRGDNQLRPEPEVVNNDNNIEDNSVERIAYFKLRLTGGRVYEFKNKTREELKQEILKIVPNMKDEIIDRLIDNPANRRVAESVYRNALNEVLSEKGLGELNDYEDDVETYDELSRGSMFMNKDGSIEMTLA